MRKYQVIENALIEDGVSELIYKLKADGYSIGFLTARSWHPKAYEVTQNFVKKYNLPVDKIVIANFKGKKTDYLNDFPGEIVGFLDDSTGHVEDFIATNISNSYLMDRPWNQDNITCPRIKNYDDFYNKFFKKNNILKKFG
jgi:uncharacterized HAD superfamily protein